MTSRLAPVFCDECSVLALAELDDRVLCAECLLAALADCPEGEVARRVRPLLEATDRHGED